MSNSQKKILVLGGGNFGTCLAQHLGRLGHQVHLWSIEKEVVDGINTHHRNPKYLSSIELSPQITAFANLDDSLIETADVILNAVPVQYMRSVFGKLKDKILSKHLLVCASKGIEVGTEALPGKIFAETLGAKIGEQAVFLSGPSFAIEVAQKLPTAVAAASFNAEKALLTQDIFHDSFFRVYTSDDPTGVEVAGALKNVVAIAAGAARGLGFQANSTAALLTRGLAEITRVGVKLGANPLTFNGLAGVGDLFLTCTSEKSRNFTVGYRLGQGETLDAIITSLGSVAEGVPTAKAAYQLSQTLGVDSPISSAVYQVLYEHKPIKEAVADLMNREAKPELTLPSHK